MPEDTYTYGIPGVTNSTRQTRPESFAGEAFRVVGGALPRAAYDVGSLITDASDYFLETEFNAPSFGEAVERFSPELAQTLVPQTKGGYATQSVATVLAGFGVLGKMKWVKNARKLSGAARVGASIAQGVVADFAFTEPGTPRLSNFFPESLDNDVLNYLRYDPNADEENLEARFKGALEGAFVGVAADAAVGGTVKLFRAIRASGHEVYKGMPAAYDSWVKDVLGRTPLAEADRAVSLLKAQGVEDAPTALLYTDVLESVAAKSGRRLPTLLNDALEAPRLKETAESVIKAVQADDAAELAGVATGRLIRTDVLDGLLKRWDASAPTRGFGDAIAAHVKETLRTGVDSTLADPLMTPEAAKLVKSAIELGDEVSGRLAKAGKPAGTLFKPGRYDIRWDTFDPESILKTPIKDIPENVAHVIASKFMADTTDDVERIHRELANAWNLLTDPKASLRAAKNSGVMESMRKLAGPLGRLSSEEYLVLNESMLLARHGGDINRTVSVKAFTARALALARKYPSPEALLKKISKDEWALGELPAFGALLKHTTGTLAEDLMGITKALAADPNDTALEMLWYARASSYIGLVAGQEAVSSMFGRGLWSLRGVSQHAIFEGRRLFAADAVLDEAGQLKPEVATMLRALKAELDKAGGALDKDTLEKLLKTLSSTGETSPEALTEALATSVKKPFMTRLMRFLLQAKQTSILSSWVTTIPLQISYGVSMNVLRLFEDSLAKGLLMATGQMDAAKNIQVFSRLSGMRDAQMTFLSHLTNAAKKDPKAVFTPTEFFDRISFDPASRMRAEGVINQPWFNQLFGEKAATTPLYAPLRMLMNGYGHLSTQLSFGVMSATDTWVSNTSFLGFADEGVTAYLLKNGYTGEAFAKAKVNLTKTVLSLATDKHVLPLGTREMSAVKRIYEDAIAAAQEMKGTQELPDGLVKDFYQFATKDTATRLFLRATVWPFLKTPINIIGGVLRRTPFLQTLSKQYRADIGGLNGPVARGRAFAQLAEGTLLFSAGATLASAGVITGRHDANSRDDLKAAGIPEYAVKIGSRWVQYNRLDPFGYFLGLSADMHRIAGSAIDDHQYEGAASGLIVAFANNTLNKTWLKGIADLMEAVKENREGFQKRYLVGQVSSVVQPFAAVQRAIRDVRDEEVEWRPDPTFEELSTYMDSLFGDQLLYPRDNGPKRDTLGRVVTRDTSGVGSIFTNLGARSWRMSDRPGIKELAKFRAVPRDIERSVLGVRLDQWEYQDFKKTLGELPIEDVLDRVVTRPGYATLSNGHKEKLLQEIVKDYYGVARKMFLVRNSPARERILSERRSALEAISSGRLSVAMTNNLRDVLSVIRGADNSVDPDGY